MNNLPSLIFGILILFMVYRLCKRRNRLKNRIATKKKEAVITIPEPEKPAIETENLLEQRLMLEETIAIIENLSETLLSSLDINALAGEIIKHTSTILNVEICALLLLDENTDTLSIIASRGIDNESIDNIRIEKGKEISGLVAKFNEKKVINNLALQASSYQLKYETCYKNNLVSVPLSIKNKVIGVLNVSDRKTGKAFSPVDVEILKIIALESAVALQNFKLIKEQHEDYLNTIIALANALDARDPYTYWHSTNVTKYAVRLAEEIKLPNRIIEDIKHAGLLHDIGKIGIRDGILMKPGKLTDEEFLQIKKHPAKGEEIIKSLPFLKRVGRIIRHHHEKFDGTGYPDGIKGEDIEVSARILKIADFFDAVTTDRSYRKAMTFEEARNELIKNKGTEFDPYLADYFLEILAKEPDLIRKY